MKQLKLTTIIDDDAITIFLADKLIRKLDFSEQVETYTRADQALKAIETALISGIQIPDVLLFDLHMPVFNGWEFIEKFSKLPGASRIPAFIYASTVTQSDIERSKKYDAIKGIILKPLSVRKLNKILRLIDKDCVEQPEFDYMPFAYLRYRDTALSVF